MLRIFNSLTREKQPFVPLTPGKVAFAWRAAVGPGIDKATTVSLDASGVLRVRAASKQWRSEVERATGLIETRLSRLLGAGTIRHIDVS